MKEYNCSIRVHSRHHLELKSEYPLLKDKKLTDYQMDFYFFFPNQLNVTGRRIGVKRFIENIKVYTRFSTPGLSLKMLVDKKNKLSPITRILNFMEIPEIKQPRRRDVLLHELQILANIYKVEVDNTVELINNEIQKRNMDSMCIRRIHVFLDEVQTFLKTFRKLHEAFINPRVSEVQRTALAWADESISITTERALNRLFTYSLSLENPEELLSSYEEITRAETVYRESMKYEYLYRENDPYSGERMAYRESILKKWSQSAMYMNLEESRTPHRVGHIIAGIAAGVAMIFAVLVTIFAGKMFIPNSLPWILLIVMSYVFKDRIKEVLREWMKKLMPRITSDQLSLLFDRAQQKKVGVSRGYAGFEKAGDVPVKILKARYQQPNPFRSILPEQDIIHYKRIIELKSRKLRDHHSRTSSITEIIRINIQDWLKEMDDPKDIFYRLENRKKLKIKGNRVYRIHLIMSLREDSQIEEEEIYHFCIVLNKIGIVRIEDLN